MQQCELYFVVTNTDYAKSLGLEVWLDQEKITDVDHVTESCEIRHKFNDVEGDHVLQIKLKNKTQQHTQIDSEGCIVSDACLCVQDISFDKIQLQPIMTELAEYSHDHNGTTDPVTDKFYGNLGCNGVVSLKFTSPVYVWLLQNL
jgi:hypothetical protein